MKTRSENDKNGVLGNISQASLPLFFSESFVPDKCLGKFPALQLVISYLIKINYKNELI